MKIANIEIPELTIAALKGMFPECDPGELPMGDRVLIQLRTVRTKTAGGIALPATTQEIEQFDTTLGRVLVLGPLAYRNRQTMEPWPEGIWAKPGDFVRCPRYSGHRWKVPLDWNERGGDSACFMICKDHELSTWISPEYAEKVREL